MASSSSASWLEDAPTSMPVIARVATPSTSRRRSHRFRVMFPSSKRECGYRGAHDASCVPHIVPRLEGAVKAHSRGVDCGSSRYDGYHGKIGFFTHGTARFKSATPVSVTFVWMSRSIFSRASPFKCKSPASVILVPSSDRYSRLVKPARCISPASVILRSEEHTSELQSLRHLVCRL